MPPAESPRPPRRPARIGPAGKILGITSSNAKARLDFAKALRGARLASIGFGGHATETRLPRYLAGKERYASRTLPGYALDHGLTEYSTSLGHSVQDLVAEFFRLRRPVEVLDVGCGTAHAGAELKQAFGARVNVSGLGLVRFPTPESLEKDMAKMDSETRGHFALALKTAKQFQANRKYLANYWAGLIETHALGGKKFDVVLANAALEHSRFILPALENLFAHLRPGGAALLGLEGRTMTDDGHVSDAIAMMKDAGYQVMECGSRSFLIRRPATTIENPIFVHR